MGAGLRAAGGARYHGLVLRAVVLTAAAALAAGTPLGTTGCSGSGGGGDAGPGAFAAVVTELQGTLLSAVVASDGTAYVAGGVVGGGAGSGVLLRWDGAGDVTPVPTPGAHAFWWIHRVSDREMLLAGEAGEVHTFDGTTVTPIDTGAPADATLFGIWGTGATDLWTVGGSFVTGGPRRVIRRNVSGTWTEVASPAEVDAEVTYFKVWGPSASDVWIVGDLGVVLRDTGGGLVRAAAPGAERYVTVHGCGAADVYAVGGGGSGAAVHFDGAGWATVPLLDVPLLSGVVCSGGSTYVGGAFGYAARLDATGPAVMGMPAELQELAIHGLGAHAGLVVAAGGDLTAAPGSSQRGFAVARRPPVARPH
jgi:hypothetical protein